MEQEFLSSCLAHSFHDDDGDDGDDGDDDGDDGDDDGDDGDDGDDDDENDVATTTTPKKRKKWSENSRKRFENGRKRSENGRKRPGNNPKRASLCRQGANHSVPTALVSRRVEKCLRLFFSDLSKILAMLTATRIKRNIRRSKSVECRDFSSIQLLELIKKRK